MGSSGGDPGVVSGPVTIGGWVIKGGGGQLLFGTMNHNFVGIPMSRLGGNGCSTGYFLVSYPFSDKVAASILLQLSP